MALRPVTFHYKSDKTDTAQFGLIAEEVARVNPDLVVRDENSEIYAVRYDAVNAIGYAKHRSRSHDSVIHVYDAAGNVIETHEDAGDFKEW